MGIYPELGRSAFNDLSVSQFRPEAGWSFSYNINESIVTITEADGGTVVHNGAFADLSTGTDPAGVAYIRTNRSLNYTPGIGATARFTAIFDTPQENSFQLIGIFNENDGWAYGYNGLKFGILRRNNGVGTWYYQEEWNHDERKSLNPQKLNVYEIKFQWLGGGMQYFNIEDANGNLSSVHRIVYANLNEDVSVQSPYLPVAAAVVNFGNTTNVTLRTPSSVAGVDGEKESPAFEALVAYERAMIIGPGETYMFGLRNPPTWLGKDNRLYISPRIMSAASDGNKSIIFRVYFGPTITNPTWTDISPNISPLQYDETGTFVLNGEAKVFTLPLAKIDSELVYLSEVDAEIQADQIFALTAESESTSDVVLSINFKSRT